MQRHFRLTENEDALIREAVGSSETKTIGRWMREMVVAVAHVDPATRARLLAAAERAEKRRHRTPPADS